MFDGVRQTHRRRREQRKCDQQHTRTAPSAAQTTNHLVELSSPLRQSQPTAAKLDAKTQRIGSTTKKIIGLPRLSSAQSPAHMHTASAIRKQLHPRHGRSVPLCVHTWIPWSTRRSHTTIVKFAGLSETSATPDYRRSDLSAPVLSITTVIRTKAANEFASILRMTLWR